MEDRERTALAAIAGPCETTQRDPLAPVIKAIRDRHPGAVRGMIYYGSCLRSGDPYDGLIDLYVVVDRYRNAHRRAIAALANRWLPPNVYYLECDDAGKRLRCKYAVIRLDDLEHGVRYGRLSTLWGRFAQPMAIVDADDATTRDRLRACCGQAVVTLLNESLPALTEPAAPADALAAALALSYGGELRTERGDRARTLADHDRDAYARRIAAARERLAFDTTLDADGRLHWYPDPSQRRRARRRWQWRRPAGHLLSVLRLAKGCFTFDNAIDYGVWKLERHTGRRIEVTARLRRHPLVFAWPLLWRLYREGLLR